MENNKCSKPQTRLKQSFFAVLNLTFLVHTDINWIQCGPPVIGKSQGNPRK